MRSTPRDGAVRVFVAMGLAVASMALRMPSSHAGSLRPVFTRVELPFDGRFAGVSAITQHGDTWWAAGSFTDNDGEHRPGLWTSPDAHAWARIGTAPITGYGEVSELYSVAASDRGVVAIGAATGGAHGNPRTVSWILQSDGVLHEVPAGFELYNGVRQISVRSIAPAPNGWVIIGSRNNRNNRLGATSWTSTIGDDFTIHDNDPALSSADREQILGLDVALHGNQLLAVGEIGVPRNGAIDTDGIAWISPDGVAWERWAPTTLSLGGHQAERPQRVVVRRQRVLIAGTETNATRTRFLAWSTVNDHTWKRTSIPALGQSADVLSNVTAVSATESEFYVGARSGDRLRLAVSPTGRAWREIRLPAGLPSGPRARLAVAASGPDRTTLLVGATDLKGGGLWRAERPLSK